MKPPTSTPKAARPRGVLQGATRKQCKAVHAAIRLLRMNLTESAELLDRVEAVLIGRKGGAQ